VDVCVGIAVYFEAFAPVAFNACQLVVGVVMKINAKTLFPAVVNGVVFGELVPPVSSMFVWII